MSEGDNPYDRMRLVLERGWLVASHSANGREGEGEDTISPGEWRGLFRRRDIPGRPASVRIPDSKTVRRGVLEQEREIHLPREQVIAAETRICREEFEWRNWTINQIAGWFSHHKESSFRSLEEGDVAGRVYQGINYNKYFKDDNLESQLYDLLLCSGIEGYKDGKRIGRPEFAATDKVWEIADTRFVRDDILSNKTTKHLRHKYFLLSSHQPNAKVTGSAESSLSSSTGKVGRPRKIRESITKRMIEKVVTEKMTELALRTAPLESLAADYGHAPATVKAAREDALLKLSEIIRNSISDD
jgi:hypothetical protein